MINSCYTLSNKQSLLLQIHFLNKNSELLVNDLRWDT